MDLDIWPTIIQDQRLTNYELSDNKSEYDTGWLISRDTNVF